MLGTFLDKLGGFFDRRFVVAYVIPTLVLLILTIVVLQILFSPSETLKWWSALGVQEQILFGVGVLLAIIVLAYLFEMLTAPIVRFYEGYWREGPLKKLAIACQQKIKNKSKRIDEIKELTDKMDKLIEEQKSLTDEEQKNSNIEKLTSVKEQLQLEASRAYAGWYYNFPHDDTLLKPTRLGNVLVASEEYSFQVYRLDAVTWWPRLATLLPEAFRIQIDTSLTPMVTVLNLSIIFIMLVILGGGTLFIWQRWFPAVIISLIGLFLAHACYLAAINQAVVYGKLVRVAFDLYRREILKQMQLTVPNNLLVERMLWEFLTNWHYHYNAPLELMSDPQELGNPFYFDTSNTSVNSEVQQEVMLTFKGSPQLTLRHNEHEGLDWIHRLLTFGRSNKV